MNAAPGVEFHARKAAVLAAAVSVLVAVSVAGRAPAAAPALPAVVRCAPERPAIAYKAGRVSLGAAQAVVPCESHTRFLSREPTIGITKTNKLFFYPAGGYLPGIDVAGGSTQRSTDVGAARLDLSDPAARWQRLQPGPLPHLNHAITFDPFMYVDRDTGRIFAADLILACSQMSFSDDEGRTWTRSLLTGCSQTDHETLFTAKPVYSKTRGYSKIVYYCSISMGAGPTESYASRCEKSLDGGLTFLPTGHAAFHEPARQTLQACGADGDNGHGVGGPDGTIYVPKANVPRSGGRCDVPELAISTNEGRTWRHSVVSRKVYSSSHDAGVGVDVLGNIYYAWQGHDHQLYLAVSRDRGNSWSAPKMISPPGVGKVFFSELAVGAPGKVAIAYVGAPTPASAEWNGYLTVTTDALDPDPTFYAAPVNPPTDPIVVGICVDCASIQDFIDVKIDALGRPWASYIDGCTGSCSTSTQRVEKDTEGMVGTLFGVDLASLG
jgi:hypothetical protein